MRTWPARPPRRARIELIPMIDVMLFLLVFFVLISSNVLPALGLKVNLPQAADAQHIKLDRRVTISIDEGGAVFLDGTHAVDLGAQLRALQTQAAHISVIIAADRAARTGALVAVLDTLKDAGIPAAAIITDPK